MVSLSPRDGTRQLQRLDSANEKDVIKIGLATVTEEPRAVDGKGRVVTAKGARMIVHRAGPRDRRASLRKEDGPVGLCVHIVSGRKPERQLEAGGAPTEGTRDMEIVPKELKVQYRISYISQTFPC